MKRYIVERTNKAEIRPKEHYMRAEGDFHEEIYT